MAGFFSSEGVILRQREIAAATPEPAVKTIRGIGSSSDVSTLLILPKV